jgi:phage antirepressor YoqD-like protein
MGSILNFQAIGAAEATMSSREIAELTGKHHFHVKRDIEKMLAELGEDTSKFGCIYVDGVNREQTEYRLNRELTETLLTGYSAVLRRKVIARWRELEAGQPSTQALPNFRDPVAAARAWADSEEQKQLLQIELAAAAPAVEFVQRYADSTGTKGFREVAKLLNANENLFREFVIEEKIMYRLAGVLTAYGNHIEAGRFCVKAGTARGNGHAYNASRFTPKGVTWVAGEWAKWQLKQREEGGHA